MTVCIATDNNIGSNNGISTFNLHLSSLLQEAGHKVVLLCTEENCNNEPDEVIQKGSLTTIIFKKSYSREKEKHTPYYLTGSFDAPRWIAIGKVYSSWLLENTTHYQIDIIEVSDYGGIGVFLCAKDLPPVVITFHGPLSQICNYNPCPEDDHYKTITKLEQISFKFAQGVIAHSQISLEIAKSLTTTPVFKTSIPWKRAKEAFITDIEDHALVIGGLQTIKGADILCRSLQRLYKHPVKPTIYWIGEDSCSSPKLTSMAEYLKRKYPPVWNRQLIWKGSANHEDVLKEIGKAGFIIIPSLWETFNYVALEAAGSGKAMILTEKTGAAELFVHGRTALIIPAQNEEALADAIKELSENGQKRRMLAQNAKQLMQSVFKNGFIEERVKIYQQIIDNFKNHAMAADIDLAFLKSYQTSYRKINYRFREFVKKKIRKK